MQSSTAMTSEPTHSASENRAFAQSLSKYMQKNVKNINLFIVLFASFLCLIILFNTAAGGKAIEVA